MRTIFDSQSSAIFAKLDAPRLGSRKSGFRPLRDLLSFVLSECR